MTTIVRQNWPQHDSNRSIQANPERLCQTSAQWSTTTALASLYNAHSKHPICISYTEAWTANINTDNRRGVCAGPMDGRTRDASTLPNTKRMLYQIL